MVGTRFGSSTIRAATDSALDCSVLPSPVFMAESITAETKLVSSNFGVSTEVTKPDVVVGSRFSNSFSVLWSTFSVYNGVTCFGTVSFDSTWMDDATGIEKSRSATVSLWARTAFKKSSSVNGCTVVSVTAERYDAVAMSTLVGGEMIVSSVNDMEGVGSLWLDSGLAATPSLFSSISSDGITVGIVSSCGATAIIVIEL